MDKVLVATIICDRKRDTQMMAIPRNCELTYPDKILYINAETKNWGMYFSEAEAALKSSGVEFYVDAWHCSSTWRRAPAFDQDQARLIPIVMARNMAIDVATAEKIPWILYVDADVVIPKDSIEKLLEMDHPIVGGRVPGRGAHSHVWYETGIKGLADDKKSLKVRYSTAGFLMIHQDIFTRLRWRWGPYRLPDKPEWQSEDPLYAADVEDRLGLGPVLLNTGLVAEHKDGEVPLTEEAVAQF